MTASAPARRPRGTPEQAEADIAAAIGRLADRVSEASLTAVNLAEEAGMSRKQLYTYFNRTPSLAEQWRAVMQRRRTEQATTPEQAAAAETTALKRRIAELERTVDDWRCVAVVARAEAERLTEVIERLRGENSQLREQAGQMAKVVALPGRAQ